MYTLYVLFQESSIDWREVEEALTVVRRNKEKGLGALSFLEQVEDDVEGKNVIAHCSSSA